MSTEVAPGATEAVGKSDDSLVWTNIYLNFALTRRDRRVLDGYLRSQDSSLSMRLRQALAETLDEAGVALPSSGAHGHDH